MATMTGKVCLITGATSGIGLETARALARQGATLAIAGRNRDKAEQAAEMIRAESGAEVTVLLADLSRMAEVRRLAGEFRARFDRLDVLVNNAGAIYFEREMTADGFELTFAVNHLAYFLLTRELLDCLKASAPSRIVNVASGAHHRGQMVWDDLQAERHYSAWSAYSQSKLANILFTRELARRLAGTGVTANSLHPGVVSTGFAVNNQGLFGWAWRLAGRFFLSPAQGAKTSIYLASPPDVAGVTGGYFDKCRLAKPAPQAEDDAAARRLWEASETMLDRLPSSPPPG